MTLRLLPAIALIAVSATAHAQQPATSPTVTAPATAVPAELMEVEGAEIHGLGGERIGEIEEVLMNPAGEIVAFTVEVGGFLGIGDREVIIDLAQLQREGGRFFVTLTREQIEALPEWDD